MAVGWNNVFFKIFGVYEFSQSMHTGAFSHENVSHYSFLPTGRDCGSVGGALGHLSDSRVE